MNVLYTPSQCHQTFLQQSQRSWERGPAARVNVPLQQAQRDWDQGPTVKADVPLQQFQRDWDRGPAARANVPLATTLTSWRSEPTGSEGSTANVLKPRLTPCQGMQGDMQAAVRKLVAGIGPTEGSHRPREQQRRDAVVAAGIMADAATANEGARQRAREYAELR